MSSQLRRNRMARNHRRLAAQPRLNLVALMDIFTILVLFLMVNSGDVEVLQADPNIELPDSASTRKPGLHLTIRISPNALSVGGEELGSPVQLLDTEGTGIISLLAEALTERAAREIPLPAEESVLGRPITIMADQATPYRLIKRVLSTCAESEYRQVSLAVNSSPAEDPLPDSTDDYLMQSGG